MRLAVFCLNLVLLTAPNFCIADPKDPAAVTEVLRVGQEPLSEGIQEYRAQGLEMEAQTLESFVAARRNNLLERGASLQNLLRSYSPGQIRKSIKLVRQSIVQASADLRGLLEKEMPLVDQLVDAEKRLNVASEEGPYRSAETRELVLFESSLSQRWLELDSRLLELALLHAELSDEPAPFVEGWDAARGAFFGAGAVFTFVMGLLGGYDGAIGDLIPHLSTIASIVAAGEGLVAVTEMREAGVFDRMRWRFSKILGAVRRLRLQYQTRRCSLLLESPPPLRLTSGD